MKVAVDARYSVVYVLGVAHCGSTLLGRLLDRHPKLWCPGELLRLDLAREHGYPCSCGEPLDRCAFWSGRLAELERETGCEPSRFRPEHYARIAQSIGKSTAIDLSKTRAWRLKRFRRDRGEGYIVLVRDLRGVLAANVRGKKPIERPLARSAKWLRRYARLLRRKSDRALLVRYEELCRDPARELARICGFLGVPYDEQMLAPVEREHHFVHSSSSTWLKSSPTIRHDERWRTELSPDQIARIEAAMRRIDLFNGTLGASFEPYAGARA